jgi:hypothetical protein
MHSTAEFPNDPNRAAQAPPRQQPSSLTPPGLLKTSADPKTGKAGKSGCEEASTEVKPADNTFEEGVPASASSPPDRGEDDDDNDDDGTNFPTVSSSNPK